MTWVHTFGEALRNLLLQIPLSAVRFLFVMSLILVLLWVCRLPVSRTQPEGGAHRWDENLKIPAGIALGLQIVIYLTL